MLGSTLTNEQAMEVPTIFDSWQPEKTYKAGEFITYGENSVGDPQLHKVVQDHTSQADWTPDVTASLYDEIGLDNSGYPVWSRPTGVHDAYNIGDVVNYNGVLYESLIDGNVYSPDSFPSGWKLYNE